MEKVFRITIIMLSLLTIETILGFILTIIYRVIEYARFDMYDLNISVKDAAFYTFARLIFYSIIQFALLYWLSSKLQMNNNVIMKWIILNCGLYIFISLLYGFVLRPETKELFTNPLFFILIISTALSPIMLYQISYFKRLMESI